MGAFRHTILILASTLLGLLGGRGVPLADDGGRHRRDHDLARQAVERGEVAPLADVLAEVRKTVPGELVGVELERQHGTWIYDIKIIAPDGTLTKVKADARTGRILRLKGK